MKQRLPFLLALICLVTAVVPASADNGQVTMGIGAGPRYAGLGIAAEYHVSDSLGVAGAVGVAGEVSGAVGVNYYLIPDSGNVRYRFSIYYGRVASARCSSCGLDDSDESFYGVSVGAGVMWRHFEIGVFYSDLSEYDEYADRIRQQGGAADDFSGVGISFGYLY